MKRLEGKVALITGAAAGIGLASADTSFITGITLIVDGGMSL